MAGLNLYPGSGVDLLRTLKCYLLSRKTGKASGWSRFSSADLSETLLITVREVLSETSISAKQRNTSDFTAAYRQRWVAVLKQRSFTEQRICYSLAFVISSALYRQR